MNRPLILLLVSLLPWHVLATTSTVAQVQPPITSEAELDRYLKQTPAGLSPLDALPLGARRRFLAGITFYPHGVGLNYSEAAAELTHVQVVALYGLFGEQKQAEDPQFGVTPERKSRLEAEQQADARARGCAVPACPESEVERRFDELSNGGRPPDFKTSSAQRVTADMRNYDRLFGIYQTPQRLRGLSAPDLRLILRATGFALYSIDDRHVAQLEMDLAEMQRREMTSDDDYLQLYQLVLSRRQFAKANTIARQHPGMKVDAIPALREDLDVHHHWPTALSIDPRKQHALVRHSYDPDVPLLIVAVTDEGCHFCEEAATAIQADARLRRLFARHGMWLAGQNNGFEYAKAWNQRYPGQPMRIAWQNSEWPKLDWSALPMFYVLRNGHVAKKIIGWNGVQKFRKSLQDAQALR